MDDDQRHINRIWRTVLICFGIILIALGFIIGDAFNILIMLILGLVLIVGGCCLWAKDKKRNPLYALWGLIPPIGFIALAILKDRTGDKDKGVDV